MTTKADRRRESRAWAIGGMAFLAIALIGCEPPPARVPSVLGPAEVWSQPAAEIAGRPEVEKVSFNEQGEPMAVFYHRDQVRNDDLAALASLPTLRWLDLVDTGITDAGLVHLARLPKLDTLYLNNIQVGDEGVAHLVGLQEMRMLHLGRTKITNGAIQSILQFPKLIELHLERTRIDDAGLQQLKALTELQEIYLTGTQATDAGIARLKADLPQVRVFFQPRDAAPVGEPMMGPDR